jgi:signal transduction histidine kinase
MAQPAVARGESTELLSFISELPRTLLDIQDLSGVSTILSLYCRHFRAFGAALWEIAEGVGGDHAGRLILQAQYFEGRDMPPFFHLPMSSISGHCIRDNCAAMHAQMDGVWDSEIAVTYPEILRDLDVLSFVSVPVILKPATAASKGADAALTFYRKGEVFTRADFADLQFAAAQFPAAYRAVQDRASLALLGKIQVELRSSHFTVNQPEKLAKETLEKVLGLIAHHFRFVESVIYLHNPLTDQPGCCSLAAALWPWRFPPLPDYRPGQGGTGWVLGSGRPLSILDVALYQEDRDYYRKKYAGMDWCDRIGIVNEVRRHFGLDERVKIFPLSYACVPILSPGAVTGVLRCCISRQGPYHVDDDILQVLGAAADRIADWWDHWTHEQQTQEEGSAAQSIMNSLGAANVYATQNLHGTFDVGKVIKYFLGVCRKSVPQADIVEVWLEEQPGSEDLVLVAGGKDPAPPPKIAALGEFRGSRVLDGEWQSHKLNAFRYVLENKTCLKVAGDAKKRTFELPTGARTACFAVAPVLGQGLRGVLLFGAANPAPWPDSIAGAASFLAEQLALYLGFNRQILQMREAQRQITESAEQQAQLFLDFQHQLRTPINITRNSVEKLRNGSAGSPEWDHALVTVTSSARRAGTVANNLQFFVYLAQGKPVAMKKSRLSVSATLASIELASGFLYNKAALNRNITFRVIKEVQTYHAPWPDFEGDPELITLAADNLMDNAVKYSFENTEVIVAAARALYGREVFLSFRSRGLPIKPDEVGKLTQRGYRGERARVTSPEGAGIGLWAVAQMMKAMGGRLEIMPTDEEQWNEVRLHFKGLEG